jgi:hypothetical protein
MSAKSPHVIDISTRFVNNFPALLHAASVCGTGPGSGTALIESGANGQMAIRAAGAWASHFQNPMRVLG